MKKNIKRIGAVLIAGTIVFAVAGCNKKEETVSKNATVEKTENVPAEVPQQENHEEKPIIETEPEKPVETLLLDADGLQIYFKGIGSDWMGTTVNLRIENATDTNLTVQARNVSVNGYMVDPIFSADVSAGKKANDTMTFFDSDLEEIGIKERSDITDIELNFHWFNSDTWDSSYDSETIKLEF